MVQTAYSASLPKKKSESADPRVLSFLLQYSKSIEVKKGKQATFILGKN
jgi:hypothetical protein